MIQRLKWVAYSQVMKEDDLSGLEQLGESCRLLVKQLTPPEEYIDSGKVKKPKDSKNIFNSLIKGLVQEKPDANKIKN